MSRLRENVGGCSTECGMMPAHGLLGSDLRVRVRVCMLSRYTATGRRMRKHMRDGSRVLLLRPFTDWWERRGSWTLVSRSYVQAVPALLSVARRTLCASAGNRANEFETPPSSRANTNDHPRPSTASAIWGDISDHGGDRGRLVSQPRACAVHETTPLIQCCGHRERGRDWGVVGSCASQGYLYDEHAVWADPSWFTYLRIIVLCPGQLGLLLLALFLLTPNPAGPRSRLRAGRQLASAHLERLTTWNNERQVILLHTITSVGSDMRRRESGEGESCPNARRTLRRCIGVGGDGKP